MTRPILDHPARRGHTGAMMIYKLLRPAEWADLQARGATPGAPIDVADGYVHFSTAAQVGETAGKYFAGDTGVMLLTVDADTLGDALKWEPSRGGALFPHLYRELRLSDVIEARELAMHMGEHVIPPLQ